MSRATLVVGIGAAAALAAYAWQVHRGAGVVGDQGGDSAIDRLLAPLYELGGAVRGMRTSPAGISAIMQREGFSATPYNDAAGFSIGYGHFIKPGEDLTHVTMEQAGELLRQDVAAAENAVNSLVLVELTQSQFDALVSFVFNVGVGNFRRSTLLRRLNGGDYAGAADELPRWNQSLGRVLPALMSRRDAERDQFLS